MPKDTPTRAPDAEEDGVVTVAIEMDRETRNALAALVYPVTMFSRQQGVPDPQLGDIIGLALRLMHSTVFSQAIDNLATGEVGQRPTAH